jgi:hypothetical protein
MPDPGERLRMKEMRPKTQCSADLRNGEIIRNHDAETNRRLKTVIKEEIEWQRMIRGLE